MSRFKLFIGIVSIVAVAMACGGSKPGPGAGTVPALTIEKVEGSDLARLKLSEQAVARLGITTVAVAEQQVGSEKVLAIPYAAVLYAADGSTWAYTSPETNVYVRAAIEIDRIDGETALLAAGPEVGTAVVTVGTAELHGAEHGVGGGH